MGELTLLNQACRDLAKLDDVAEIKEVRDKAETVRRYCKLRGDTFERQQQAAEIKLRAERRLGEVLGDVPREEGGRPRKNSPHSGVGFYAFLRSVDIARSHADRWQTLAKIPEDQFNEFLKLMREAQDELTTAAMLRAIQKLLRKTPHKAPPLPEDIYDVILADPPWRYDFSETASREIERQYPTMEVEEIVAIDVPFVTADNAVLFLWATAPKLQEALAVCKAWGFEYKTHAVWDKEKIGMGYWFRGQHELLLVCTRGSFPPPEESTRFASVIRAPRTEHSRKPDQIFELIETLVPNAQRKLEMFQRTPRDGWDGWGDEA